jgi:hypothetical protein
VLTATITTAIALTFEAVSASEESDFFETTRHNIPDGCHLHIRCRREREISQCYEMLHAASDSDWFSVQRKLGSSHSKSQGDGEWWAVVSKWGRVVCC